MGSMVGTGRPAGLIKARDELDIDIDRLGQKLTCRPRNRTSAVPRTTDILDLVSDVRSVPLAEVDNRQTAAATELSGTSSE